MKKSVMQFWKMLPCGNIAIRYEWQSDQRVKYDVCLSLILFDARIKYTLILIFTK